MILIFLSMNRYLTSLLLSVTANKINRDLFRMENSTERIAEVGLRKVPASRAIFSEAGDRMIVSLQAEHGKNFALIAKRINETFETNYSNDVVRKRFKQLEKEEKDGGRKLRRIIFSNDDDDQIRTYRAEYPKKNNGSTRGMWVYMSTKMPGKTKQDLRNRWNRHLSMTSAATATTSTALTLTDNQPNLFGVSLDGTSTATTKVAATKVAATMVATTLTATTKVAVKKVAAKKKVAPSSDSEQRDGYSSSESDAELLAPPQVIGGLSEYELLRARNVARNNERLDMLGLGSVPKEVKKVVKKRKSPPVNEPLRALPVRQRKTTSYNDDYTEDVY